MAGASRSPSLCCAYVMWKHRIDLTKAMDIVSQAHTLTNPNASFLAQLRQFGTALESDINNLPNTSRTDIVSAPGNSCEIGRGEGHPDEDSDMEHNLDHNLTEEDWM